MKTCYNIDHDYEFKYVARIIIRPEDFQKKSKPVCLWHLFSPLLSNDKHFVWVLFTLTHLIHKHLFHYLYNIPRYIGHRRYNILNGGFGLYLSYLSKLTWTSIGYSMMIVAVTIQLYPLVNAFWSKFSFFPNALYQDSFTNKGFSLYLANFDSSQATGNTITGAIKCSLAIIIGLTGIIGRSGPFEVLIFTIFSTITYELNRQLAAKIGIDNFGSFTIFGFGGFLSFGSGIIYLFR